MNNKLIYIALTLVFSAQLIADDIILPPAFEATYAISRGGKPTAEQVTRFSNKSNSFRLNDQTTGTHGLAAMTGFSRIETTDFSISQNTISEIKHLMKQNIAFSKKSYQFEKQNNAIIGKGKKKFTISSETIPISAHLMPIWLSSMVCSGMTQIKIPVLKSNKVKDYYFSVFDESDLYYRVERQYSKDSSRSTKIWFDKSQHCFPTKTLHQEKDDPSIATQLMHVKFNKSN